MSEESETVLWQFILMRALMMKFLGFLLVDVDFPEVPSGMMRG